MQQAAIRAPLPIAPHHTCGAQNMQEVSAMSARLRYMSALAAGQATAGQKSDGCFFDFLWLVYNGASTHVRMVLCRTLLRMIFSNGASRLPAPVSQKKLAGTSPRRSSSTRAARWPGCG